MRSAKLTKDLLEEAGYLQIAALDAGSQANRLYAALIAYARELEAVCPACFGPLGAKMNEGLKAYKAVQPNLAINASDAALHGAIRLHRNFHPNVPLDEGCDIRVDELMARFSMAAGVAWRYHHHVTTPTPINAAFVPLVARLRAAGDPYKELIAMASTEELQGLTTKTLCDVDQLLAERLAVCAGIPHELLIQLGNTQLTEAIAAARASLHQP
jgi:hypothetical protein